jgi:DNA-binding transcriptional ArsR family regulator
MLRQAPLLATDRGGRLFVPPRGFDALVAYVRRGYNVLLLADRGEGKTSTLHQLERALEDDVRKNDHTPTVFVDLAEANRPAEALEIMIAAGREVSGQAPNYLGEYVQKAFLTDSINPWLRQLATVQGCCFLLDNADSQRVAYPLFGALRDRVWEQLDQHQFVLAANHADRKLLLRPPADAFWEQAVDLEITEQQAAEVIERGLGESAPWAHDLIATVGTNLRRLIQAAQQIDAGEEQPPSSSDSWKRWQQAVGNLSRSASMVFAELEELGEVGTADKRLAERMGYSKTTIVRALEELEGAGLVTSDQRSEGPGRPRKIYSLVR